MQIDFHYYATYCAAVFAGYSHREAMELSYAAQLVDCCTSTMLRRVGGPARAATTQLQLELADARTDPVGLQDMTRIWASFHFLPGDLYSPKRKGCGRRYMNKYRLICNVNSDLLVKTVELARDKGTQAAGIAMHVLADTWAHRYFAGTPSFVINNATAFEDAGTGERIRFSHNIKAGEDVYEDRFTSSVYRTTENNIMNLGHGRAGHLPDYSFMRYRYMPAWKNYEMVTKDNPAEYFNAFGQMIHAMKYLRGETDSFEKGTYETAVTETYRDVIMEIFRFRQPDSSADWKAFARKVFGQEIEDFDERKYEEEYVRSAAEDKADTYLGRFFDAALAQKRMVSSEIYKSGNNLAGRGGKL